MLTFPQYSNGGSHLINPIDGRVVLSVRETPALSELACALFIGDLSVWTKMTEAQCR